MASLKAVQALGQSVWLDFISRELLESSRFRGLVEEGVSGMTSNPTIFDKAISKSRDYDEDIRAAVNAEPGISTKALYERLAVKDIKMAADVLKPVYDSSGGVDGLVSLEASPHLAYDTEGTMTEVRRLWRLVDRPNVMIKVPATPQGVPAIEQLTAEGINVNITLMFSMKHYEAVAQAYIRGISRCQSPGKVRSVASFFVSRVDTYIDRELDKYATPEARELRGKTSIANAKLVYRRFREVFHGPGFASQRERGARLQHPLWGSTSTKDPAYSDVLYIEELIGPDTVNTVPLETLEAFLDHGRARPTLEHGVSEAERILGKLGALGIDLGAVTEQIQSDGVKAFADSFTQLFRSLEEKCKLLAVSPSPAG